MAPAVATWWSGLGWLELSRPCVPSSAGQSSQRGLEGMYGKGGGTPHTTSAAKGFQGQPWQHMGGLQVSGVTC